MLTAWGLAVLCAQTRVEPLVLPGVRLPEVVKALRQVTGQNLTVDPRLVNEAVVVYDRLQDPEAFRLRLARATSTKWVPIPNGGWRLEPDSDLRRQEVIALESARAAALQSALSKEKVRLDSMLASDRELSQPEADRGLMISVVAGFSPGVWTRLRPGERIVFSTNPTAAQRPLDLRRYPRQLRESSAVTTWLTLQRPRTDVGSQPRLNLQLIRLDGEGKRSGQSSAELRGDADLPKTDPESRIPVPDGWEPQFSLPWQAVQQYRRGAARGQVPPELLVGRTYLEEPWRYDPVRFAYGEAMCELAKAKEWDLVAVVPDETSSEVGSTSQAVAQLWESMTPTHLVQRKGSEVSLTPRWPAALRASRRNWNLLHQIYERTRSDGVAPTALVMAWLIECEDRGATGGVAQSFGTLPELLALSQNLTIPLTEVGLGSIRFLTKLDAREQLAMRQGGLRFESLNVAARNALEEAVYWDMLALSRQALPAAQADDPWGVYANSFGQSMLTGISRLPGGSRDFEPTVALPQGLRGTMIEASQADNPYFFPVTAEGDRAAIPMPLSLADVAILQIILERSGPNALTQQSYAHLALGNAQRVRTTIRFGDGICSSFEMVYFGPPDRRRTYNVAALPAGLRDEVQRRREEYLRGRDGQSSI